MNIVVVVEDMMVENYKKWSEVEKNHPTLEKKDFVKHGDDYVLLMNPESYRITRDIKLLESVATQAVFGKKRIDWATAAAASAATIISFVLLT